jgi:aryl-alcohol dehydrogenase-like predicted oxidoreductase
VSAIDLQQLHVWDDSWTIADGWKEAVPEDTLLPACARAGVAIIARVPFDEGSLTGTLRAGASWPDGDWRNTYFAGERLTETLRRVEPLRALADRSGLSLSALALRFILSDPVVTTTIPGMRQRRHVDQNLECSDSGPLDQETMTALRAHRWDRIPDDRP